MVYFVKHFKHYLYGKKFTVRTDHGSLRWLMQFKNPEGQIARWLEVLSEFDFEIVHRPGQRHNNADALSRIPCKQCGYNTDWEKKLQNEKGIVRSVNGNLSNEFSQVEQLTLKELQENDKDIQFIKGSFLNKKRPQFLEISGKSLSVRCLWSQWDILEVFEGILYRRFETSDNSKNRLQAIVPYSERRNVLFQCHDNKTSAHLGVRKTIERIRQKYYWPGLQADVRRYIKGCEFCNRRKNPCRTNKAPMQLVQSCHPMERIAADILGELPETENGNRYILVVSDYFSKWTESFAMPNMEAVTVANLIVEQVVARFGVPSYLHSDQGRQFESKLFSEMCRLLNIKKTRTTPYHPQSDGQVERFNKTLETMLSAYVNDHHKDWDKHLPYVMMAYRSAEHETTGYTPNYLMFGREVF